MENEIAKTDVFDEEYYKVSEIAERLKVSRQAVYAWIESGKLKAIRADRIVRIPKSSLSEFLQPIRPDELPSEDSADGE
jgi:excisionase family DNA binding protein